MSQKSQYQNKPFEMIAARPSRNIFYSFVEVDLWGNSILSRPDGSKKDVTAIAADPGAYALYIENLDRVELQAQYNVSLSALSAYRSIKKFASTEQFADLAKESIEAYYSEDSRANRHLQNSIICYCLVEMEAGLRSNHYLPLRDTLLILLEMSHSFFKKHSEDFLKNSDLI